jgi:hypothetical protein
MSKLSNLGGIIRLGRAVSGGVSFASATLRLTHPHRLDEPSDTVTPIPFTPTTKGYLFMRPSLPSPGKEFVSLPLQTFCRLVYS